LRGSDGNYYYADSRHGGGAPNQSIFVEGKNNNNSQFLQEGPHYDKASDIFDRTHGVHQHNTHAH